LTRIDAREEHAGIADDHAAGLEHQRTFQPSVTSRTIAP
jgi:hypothetical protein